MAQKPTKDILTIQGTIAWVTLLVLVFLIPVTFSAPSASSVSFTADLFDTPKVWLLRVGVMVLLAAWGSDILFHGGKIRYHKAVLLLFGVLTVVFIASTLTSIEPMQSFLGKYRRYDGFWSFLLYGVLMWVTLQYATTTHRVRQVMVALSVSSILVAGYGLLQALGLEIFRWGNILFEHNRSFSTYGNPNLLAGFLAFSIFVNLALALTERDTTMKSIFWIATLFNVAVSITAFSRSVWVAGFVGIVVFVLFLLRFKPRLSTLDKGFLGATVLVGVGTIIRSLFSETYVMNFGKRVASIFDFSSGSSATRFQIWDAAWRSTLQRPVLGWGADTFRMVFRLFQPATYNHDAGYRSVADNAHNYLLQVASGIGLIGAVLLYALQVVVLVLAARYAWKQSEHSEPVKKSKRTLAEAEEREEKNRDARLRYIGLLVAALTYCIHLFFGISVPGCTFLLWIIFGILLVPLAKIREVAPAHRWLAVAGCVALILIAVVSSYFATGLLWADRSFSRAQSAQAAGNLEQAMGHLEASMRLSPSNDQYAMKYTELVVEAASKGIVPIDTALATVDRMIERFPNEYDVYLVALWAYGSIGTVNQNATERGLALATDAVSKYPQGLALRYTYAELLVKARRTNEAIEQLQFAVSSDPNFAEARDLLISLQ